MISVTLPCFTVSLVLSNFSFPLGFAVRCRFCGGFDFAAPAALIARLPTTTATTADRPAVPRVIGPPLGSDGRYAPGPRAVRSVRCGDAPRRRRGRHVYRRRPARRRTPDHRQGAKHAEGPVGGRPRSRGGRAREG